MINSRPREDGSDVGEKQRGNVGGGAGGGVKGGGSKCVSRPSDVT